MKVTSLAFGEKFFRFLNVFFGLKMNQTYANGRVKEMMTNCAQDIFTGIVTMNRLHIWHFLRSCVCLSGAEETGAPRYPRNRERERSNTNAELKVWPLAAGSAFGNLADESSSSSSGGR
jgi:hypothetical protein